MEKGFYLVWNPAGRNPQYRHTTEDAAKREADRLAREHVGQSFFVLGAVCLVIKEDVKTTYFESGCDKIPF